MFSSIIEFFLFVASTGVLFSERFRANQLAVLTAGCVAIASSWFLGETILDKLGYLHHAESSSLPNQPSPPLPQPASAAPQPKSPTVEQIFPPESAVDIRPIPGAPQLTFFLADWVSWSASDINLSTWILQDGSFVKVSTKQYSYLGSGDNITLTEPLTSGAQSSVAICMSYLVNKHHVEVIQFFSNPDGSGYRRARDNVFQVDGQGQLCESMPAPAARALRQ